MSDDVSGALPVETDDGLVKSVADAISMDLRVERAYIAKRTLKTILRAARTTRSRPVSVEAMLAHDRVVIERIPIGRVVDAVPPIRTEGDTTILPVVEEEVVVTRRLLLKEEVHLRRVRTTERHVETVAVREQVVTVTRTSLDTDLSTPVPLESEASMSNETIVAVFDTAAHANDAVSALKEAGVPETAISVHADKETRTGSTTTAVDGDREPGFWSSLFGGDSGHDSAVYNRSLQSGSTVVSVDAPEEHITRVTDILERFHPIDIDDRADTYGVRQTAPIQTGSTQTGTVAPMQPGTIAPKAPATTPVMAERGAERETARGPDSVQLSEERLSVGKRLVNRGGTRIRRYVVETPVEQDVTLHSEKVMLDRHAVTDGRPVGDSFTDRTIEMTESSEEPVVQKTARVYEEVGLRKESSDRVEKVKDTVRREEVEVEQVPAGTTKPHDKI